MAGALRAWIERRELPNAREDSRALLLDEIELVRDIETTVIRVPAGAQDYYGAMFGGLEKITWGPARSSERFDYPTETLDGLGDRMLLFYSGTSRNSGINNWHLYKTLIDDTEKVSAVSEDFRQIVDATSKLHLALKQQNWKLIGEAIDQEFQARRHLAPGISTPEIDRALDLARKERNSTVGKICGAGGGGCFFLYTPEPWKPEQTALFRSRLTEIPGMLALDLKPAPLGREVRILSS
jgi:D-glycero-alpha-D-manno-heptose-7-phosphate kinase